MTYKKHSSKKILAASLLAALLPGGVLMAEDAAAPVFTLDGIVVTATRSENRVEKVPASTQVITQEDIRKSSAPNLRGVLSAYTNIFQKTKTTGGGHNVIIRGMSTEKSLILVNGRRLANEADASGLGNAHALDRINMADVERIEIVKGPSSALYGSEAMGGVVNIITRPSREPSISTGFEYAKDGRTNWYHLDTGRQGNLSVTADARFNKTTRDMDDGDTSTNDYGTAQTYNVSANYYFNENNYLNLYGGYFSQHLKSDTGTPSLKDYSISMGRMNFGGQAMVDGGTAKNYKQKNYGLSWNGKTDRNEWQIQAYASQFKWSDETTSRLLQCTPASDKTSQTYFPMYMKTMYNTYDFNADENSMWALEGRDTMKIGDRHRLTFGGEYVKNNVKGTGLGGAGEPLSSVTVNGVTKERSEKTIETYAAYVQDEIEIGKWFIVPAIRYDHHSIYGSHSSPKLGVTYSAGDHFRVKANFGHAFKAPSISQLYYDLDRQMGESQKTHIIGNAHLKPEKSDSWDLSVEGEWGKSYGSLTYFDNDVENLITAIKIGQDSNKHSLYQYRNINTARIKGVENVLGHRLSDRLDFKVTSTWLDAEDTTNHTRLTERARLTQIYALTYDDHKDTGWTAMLWDQYDYHYLTSIDKDGQHNRTYSLWNLSLSRKFNKNTRVYGLLANIFDKKDDAADLDGRYWSIGVEHRF